MMKFQWLVNPKILETAKNHINGQGQLFQKSDGYVYLKMSDDFIHRIFPLIQEEGWKQLKF